MAALSRRCAATTRRAVRICSCRSMRCALPRPSPPRDISAVAIGAGPGSFTGLRIGMATAKGIAFAAACPLWAVSSLAALAHELLEAEPQATVLAVLDARKGEAYAGAYRRDADRIVAVGVERVLPPDQLAAFAPVGARIVGDFIEVLDGHSVVFPRTPSGAGRGKARTRGCAQRRADRWRAVVHPAVRGRGQVSRWRTRCAKKALGSRRGNSRLESRHP